MIRTIHPMRSLGSIALIASLFSCVENEVQAPEASFSHGASPEERHVFVCKVGSSATFDVVGGDVANVTLADGECQSVASHPGDPSTVTVTVTESSVTPGFGLNGVTVELFQHNGILLSTTTESGPSVTVDLIDDHYIVLTYENVDLSQGGRMTGGQNIRVDANTRITGGLTLHCDITLSNNLQINWPGGNKWHLEKESLSSVICIDDPAYNPVPPAAPFDTFIAEAVGTLNGNHGSIIRFTFIDNGEPGTTDEAHFKIWAVGADPDTDTPVLDVSGLLTHGNFQAHFDQPHK